MEYFGETNKLSKTLSDQRLRVKTYGSKRAKRIGQRLAEFSHARSLNDISHLPPARLHKLSGDHSNQFVVDIESNWRIVFEGYDREDILSTEKSQIVTLSIVRIEDYH